MFSVHIEAHALFFSSLNGRFSFSLIPFELFLVPPFSSIFFFDYVIMWLLFRSNNITCNTISILYKFIQNIGFSINILMEDWVIHKERKERKRKQICMVYTLNTSNEHRALNIVFNTNTIKLKLFQWIMKTLGNCGMFKYCSTRCLFEGCQSNKPLYVVGGSKFERYVRWTHCSKLLTQSLSWCHISSLQCVRIIRQRESSA